MRCKYTLIAKLKRYHLQLNYRKRQDADINSQSGAIDFLGFTFSKSDLGWEIKTSAKNLSNTKLKIDSIVKIQNKVIKDLHKEMHIFLCSHCGYFALKGNEKAVLEVYRYANESWSRFCEKNGFTSEACMTFMPPSRYEIPYTNIPRDTSLLETVMVL